jgi:type I restriction enzyme S subunit
LVSNIRPYLKKVWVADKEGGASNDVIVIRPKERLLTQYFPFLLKNDSFIGYVMAGAKGVKMPRGDIGSMKEYPAFYPSKPEQQKIADCLTSVDDLITAQARKLDALKTHKKGVMQHLFPREGETQPRLRFPEFQNAGEWEEKRPEHLAKRASGHTPSKSKPQYYNGGIKWVSLADSKRLDCGLISDTAIEISEQGIENSSAVLHQAGTVLISRDAGVGKSAIMSLPMAVSQHFIVWTCNRSLLSNWFLYHLLQKSKPLFERAATGSTIKTIGLQFFIDLRFRIPSLPEQHRIADCLTSLDDLIAAQTQKLASLKLQKKGLMQQLFPSPEEVAA